MLIQHDDKSTATLGHNGEHFEAVNADEGGVFSLPDHIANDLLRFPHWHVFHRPHIEISTIGSAKADSSDAPKRKGGRPPKAKADSAGEGADAAAADGAGPVTDDGATADV